MATVKRCPLCGPDSQLETDYSAGNVVCYNCGQIVEEGILVSEVGFAEAAGGRVHVQGTFVSNYSTGIAGFRGGRGGQPNNENIKAQGAQRIENVARSMHLSNVITQGAKRFFSLAVDNKFTRGRRTEYIVASCLYLQCRLQKDAHMLIDFSERININVFELGATYLKLRAILSLLEPMPEVDPAIYNLRFAHRLDFGPMVHTVATDASRLVRRFRADWMTQGRRPAGVCGACLIIAARMSNFLRTPDEVAQVVKVAPQTVKKRLLEFAQTGMAKKTVAEWRALTDAQLNESDNAERPPAVKNAEARQLKIEALKRKEEAENGEELEDDEDNDDEDNEDGSDRKRRKGKGREKAFAGAVKAVRDEYGDGGEDEEEEEDDNMDPLSQMEYTRELEAARENPEAARAERELERKMFMKEVRKLKKPQPDVAEEQLDHLAEQGETLGDDEDNEKTDEFGNEPATQLRSVNDEETQPGGRAGHKTEAPFTEWHDESAVISHLQNKVFAGEELLYQGRHMISRIKMWVGVRDPQEVMREMEVVDRARAAREKEARMQPETDFGDLDDDELEMYFKLEEDEKQARARMWLSSNGRWLEEEKERQEKRAAESRAKGLDPSKPKNKRKRAAPKKGPFPSTNSAIHEFAKAKQFSSRVNYDVLRTLGIGTSEMAGAEHLVSFDDEKDDEKDDEEY